jgi:anti-sigma B factor antagonist
VAQRTEGTHPGAAGRHERPPTSVLRLDTVRDGADATVFALGDLDAHTCDPLRDAVAVLAADPSVERVILDVAGIRFVDSSGLGTLVGAHRRATRAGKALHVRSPAVQLHGLLTRTGLGPMLLGT